MKQKNFYKLIAILYLVIPLLLVNFNSAFLSITTTPESENFIFWEKWMTDPNNKIFAIIISIFVSIAWLSPFVFIICYLVPVFFEKKNANKKIVNTPIFLALFNSLFTLLLALVYFITCTAIYINSGKFLFDVMLFTVMLNLLAAALIFSLIYLVLETLNRTFVLKKIFTGGNISGTAGLHKHSLVIMFLSFFLGFVFCPVAYALFFDYKFSIDYGFTLGSENYFRSLFFVLAGTLVTILLANIFRKPLKKFTAATKRIAEGNYKDKVEIYSADELGDLSDTFNQMQKSLVEKDFMRDTFGKIVSPEIRDYILNNKVSLGGETKDVTVMFCDIRSFTSLSEKLKSEEVVQMLNIYFTAMEKCIASHHGIINKYIGDAVMAIFGTPVETPHHALDAYLAGLEMHNVLGEVNKKFAELGFPEIRNGIGLHTGAVLAGNIGAENRMEFTVIGDTVNVASRIEGLCKEYKKDFLISETTASEIEKAISEMTSRSNTATPADNATSKAGGSGETPNVIPPTFLCESAIRGKEEKIKLYWG